MRTRRKATFTFLTILSVIGMLEYFESRSAYSLEAERIIVYADQDVGPVKYLQGFVHGLERHSSKTKNDPQRLIGALKPRFWRLGIDDFSDKYRTAKSIDAGIKITLVLSDIYADVLKGGYDKVRPWENWDAYERDIKFIIEKIKGSGLRVDYWDVWSEPDTPSMWPGTCPQLLELFKRTYHAVRQADRNAKIVGPSISGFSAGGTCPQPFLGNFLEYLAAHDLRFDAISWHEFDFPDDLPDHVELVRKVSREKLGMGPVEIHINEYSGPADHLIPGWAVGWLHYLEKAKVDWASRACWDVTPRWNNCLVGLNGLFLSDNHTPQPVYWVHRAYAEMTGRRIATAGSSTRTVAIASREDRSKEIRLLVGRYRAKEKKWPPADVEIEIRRPPNAEGGLKAEVYRIPGDVTPAALPNGPISTATRTVPVTNGVARLPLPAFRDGDAYLILLKPAPPHSPGP